MRANLDALAEYDYLVNGDTELGLAWMLGQELGCFTSIMELLYIWVQLGRTDGWRILFLSLMERENVLLISRRLGSRRRRAARVPMKAWRLGPAISIWGSWARLIPMGWTNTGSAGPIVLLWLVQWFLGTSPVHTPMHPLEPCQKRKDVCCRGSHGSHLGRIKFMTLSQNWFHKFYRILVPWWFLKRKKQICIFSIWKKQICMR
jgi:hypothetical protein